MLSIVRSCHPHKAKLLAKSGRGTDAESSGLSNIDVEPTIHCIFVEEG